MPIYDLNFVQDPDVKVTRDISTNNYVSYPACGRNCVRLIKI